MNNQDDHDNDHPDHGNHRVDDDDIDYDGIVDDDDVDYYVDDEDDSERVRESRCLPCGTPCLQKLKLNPTCPMSIHRPTDFISLHYVTKIEIESNLSIHRPTAAESSHFISLHYVAKIEIESNFIVFTFH